MLKYLPIIVLMLSAEIAFAQTCCSGGVPLSGNLGLPPGKNGAFQISISHDINILNTLKAGSNELSDDSRKRLTNSTIIELGYSINNRLSVDLFGSYVTQTREITQFGNVNTAKTRGIGDAVILLKYQLINSSNQSLTIGAGPKLPTGASDLQSNGFTENADLQPGSGAWDGIVWTNYIRNIGLRPTTSVFGTFTYALKGTNDEYLGSESFKFSNEFQSFIGISDRFHTGSLFLDPSVGLRYRTVDQDRQNDIRLPNTGGDWVFLVPSITSVINEKLSFSISTEIPVYSRLEGTQLTPTMRFNGGFLYIINSKKLDINIK